MDVHKNARSCPASGALLAERVKVSGGVAVAARAAGISRRGAYEWLRRYQAGGVPALNFLIEALEHSSNHYGQMVEYLRMNRIVPPAS